MKARIRGRAKYQDQYRCSFCGKGAEDVRRLIAGPGVYICNECVELCREIVDEVELSTTPSNGERAERRVFVRDEVNEVLAASILSKGEQAEAGPGASIEERKADHIRICLEED